MGNGRGSWNQHYGDSINDKIETIEELEDELKKLGKSKKVNSWTHYLKPSFYAKTEDEKEIIQKIERLKKSIKNDQMEMYD
ncbi:MAG: hypothetical protein U9O56_02790 [Campylobacterota bacterium]|nr:hypothetical protein [Campylobacterota bacterium]